MKLFGKFLGSWNNKTESHTSKTRTYLHTYTHNIHIHIMHASCNNAFWPNKEKRTRLEQTWATCAMWQQQQGAYVCGESFDFVEHKSKERK